MAKGYEIKPPAEEPSEDLPAEEPVLTTEPVTPLTDEQQAALEEARAAAGVNVAPEGSKRVTAAFLILINEDGSAYATNDFDTEFQASRMATPDDMLRATHYVHEDLLMGKTSQSVVIQMMAMTAQMQEQAKNQAIAAKLQQKGGHRAPGGLPRR